jgi:hypothetical protein
MINTKTRNYFVALALLGISTLSAPAHAQVLGDRNYSVATSDGQMIVWNENGIHFLLHLKGKNVRIMEQPPGGGSIAFNADGVVFQVTSAPLSEFAKNARKQKLGDQAILAAYLDWERRYHEQELGTKLTVTSTEQQLPSGTQVLLWKLDIPKDKASNQLYCTAVCGTQVIILAGVINRKTPESAVQKLLLDTMSTLKVSSRPIVLPLQQ